MPEHFSISESELELIYTVIDETRKNKVDIEIPASIRAGIAMAKLLGRRKAVEKKDELKERETSVHLGEIAKHVLLGSIKPKPGGDVEQVIESVIRKTLGV